VFFRKEEGTPSRHLHLCFGRDRKAEPWGRKGAVWFGFGGGRASNEATQSVRRLSARIFFRVGVPKARTACVAGGRASFVSFVFVFLFCRTEGSSFFCFVFLCSQLICCLFETVGVPCFDYCSPGRWSIMTVANRLCFALSVVGGLGTVGFARVGVFPALGGELTSPWPDDPYPFSTMKLWQPCFCPASRVDSEERKLGCVAILYGSQWCPPAYFRLKKCGKFPCHRRL